MPRNLVGRDHDWKRHWYFPVGAMLQCRRKLLVHTEEGRIYDYRRDVLRRDRHRIFDLDVRLELARHTIPAAFTPFQPRQQGRFRE